MNNKKDEKVELVHTGDDSVEQNESTEEKVYTLTEEQFNKLTKKETVGDNVFEEDLAPVEERPTTPRKHTCKIVLYRKNADSQLGVLTDLRTIRYDKDPETKLYNIDILEATISYPHGKDYSFDFPIGDFIKIFTIRETVDIIKEERKKMKMDKGQIYKTKSKKESGIITRMAGEITDTIVPMRERFLVPTITVKRKNGQKLILSSKVVNI